MDLIKSMEIAHGPQRCAYGDASGERSTPTLALWHVPAVQYFNVPHRHMSDIAIGIGSRAPPSPLSCSHSVLLPAGMPHGLIRILSRQGAKLLSQDTARGWYGR